MIFSDFDVRYNSSFDGPIWRHTCCNMFGQSVQFSGRGKIVKGRLTKINLKTAVVSESNSPNKWKVSISMLEAA